LERQIEKAKLAKTNGGGYNELANASGNTTLMS
jgi:hypothetical protein